jgi:hypothetical protein
MRAFSVSKVSRSGTAKELARGSTGYSASGESQHSRQAAHGGNMKLPGYVENVRGKRTRGQLIEQHKSLLAKLRGDILIEDNKARRAKLERNFEIKTKFLNRLLTEKENDR